jgi:hypothetical protein
MKKYSAIVEVFSPLCCLVVLSWQLNNALTCDMTRIWSVTVVTRSLRPAILLTASNWSRKFSRHILTGCWFPFGLWIPQGQAEGSGATRRFALIRQSHTSGTHWLMTKSRLSVGNGWISFRRPIRVNISPLFNECWRIVICALLIEIRWLTQNVLIPLDRRHLFCVLFVNMFQLEVYCWFSQCVHRPPWVAFREIWLRRMVKLLHALGRRKTESWMITCCHSPEALSLPQMLPVFLHSISCHFDLSRPRSFQRTGFIEDQIGSSQRPILDLYTLFQQLSEGFNRSDHINIVYSIDLKVDAIDPLRPLWSLPTQANDQAATHPSSLFWVPRDKCF